MPLLKRRRILAGKIETTIGTAETLTATEAAMNIRDVEVQSEIESIERPGQSAFSPLCSSRAGDTGRVTFTTDLTGDGAAGTPLWASTFLPACGFVVATGTFSPNSAAPGSATKTCTIGVYQDGLFKRLKGCQGTAVINLPAGRPASIDFDFMGVWDAPTDVALLTPTYPTVKPLRFVSSTLTLGGSGFTPLSSITIDLGNDIAMREDATTASGYISALIGGRRITGSMNPEATLVGTEDYYGDWIALTEQALSLTLTDGTDTVTIAAPKLQFTNVQEGERDNLQTDDIEFQCNRSAAAGDDELTIDFS